MTILDTLKKDHISIIEALEVVAQQSFNTDDSKQAIFKIKETLLAHLKREDDDFYPTLKEHALKDIELAKTLDDFSEDMAKISKEALAFFEKHSQNSEDASLKPDLLRLTSYLKRRIVREEKVLFTVFEKTIH